MILIAGGGIAGCALGLTCHQLGLPFRVFEQVSAPRPLGVGINIQPPAVRELFAMGFEEKLPEIGIETREFALFTRFGLEVWAEPRGRAAGYAFPQYSVHRGRFHMMLLRALVERAGPEAVVTGWRATGFDQDDVGVRLHLTQAQTGDTGIETGAVLIAADGIHSATRAQLYPGEGPPVWDGRMLWRGTAKARAFRTGATMAIIGHDTQRVVAYPISSGDPSTGEAEINWIAELTVDRAREDGRTDWNRAVRPDAFLPRFEDWAYDWLDFPSLVGRSAEVLEYPMVDRDPLPRWSFGRVTLMGDAAHPAYPTGSNGGTQAVLDARRLGLAFREAGVTPEALSLFDTRVRAASNRIVLANCTQDPAKVLQVVEDRCGGRFADIADVMPHEALVDHATGYKKLAGLSIQAVSAEPPILAAARSGTRSSD